MPFDLQLTLGGELLTLRPLRPDDFEALYAVALDPLIWEQHPASDRHQRDVFEEFFQEALACGGAFLVFDNASGAVIGSSRYFGYDGEKSEIEIGWTFLARSHWGGRCNAEMKRLMLAHAFQFVRRVVFLVGPQNLRSQNVAEGDGEDRRRPRRLTSRGQGRAAVRGTRLRNRGDADLNTSGWDASTPPSGRTPWKNEPSAWRPIHPRMVTATMAAGAAIVFPLSLHGFPRCGLVLPRSQIRAPRVGRRETPGRTSRQRRDDKRERVAQRHQRGSAYRTVRLIGELTPGSGSIAGVGAYCR
jgi:RimJ/RimL family protein N-acetyltransferase